MSKRFILKILIFIVLVTQFYFFDLVPKLNYGIGGINSEASKKLLFGFLIAIVVISILPEKTNIIEKNRKYLFTLPVWFLVVADIYVTIMTARLYDQTIVESLANGYNFLLIIGYFGLAYFLTDQQNFEFFYRVIRGFGFFI